MEIFYLRLKLNSLKAKTIEYNFKEKKGFILEVYGTTSFKSFQIYLKMFRII